MSSGVDCREESAILNIEVDGAGSSFGNMLVPPL